MPAACMKWSALRGDVTMIRWTIVGGIAAAGSFVVCSKNITERDRNFGRGALTGVRQSGSICWNASPCLLKVDSGPRASQL